MADELQDQIDRDPAEVLTKILQLGGIEANIERSDDDERIHLEVSGPDSGLVIGKQGMTLDALQFLVNKIVYREGRGPRAVVLDAEGYRTRRAEALASLAKRLAEDARRTGRRVPMAPMSATDRRIVHMTLSALAGVTTQSEGEGLNRRIVIIPTGDDEDCEAADIADDEAL